MLDRASSHTHTHTEPCRVYNAGCDAVKYTVYGGGGGGHIHANTLQLIAGGWGPVMYSDINST